MAAVFFNITPEELERSATQIQERAATFAQRYNTLRIAVQDLRVSFKGETSDAFNKKITEREKDFADADAALKRYIATVRAYATEQKRNETVLTGQVNGL